jgi:hypothetical protein
MLQLCTTTGIQNTAVGACSLRVAEHDGGRQHWLLYNEATRPWCFFLTRKYHWFLQHWDWFLALQGSTTGQNNTAVGSVSLWCNTTGTTTSLWAATPSAPTSKATSRQQSAIEALRNQNPVGNADMNNTAVGYQAALCTTTGCQNTAIGSCALRLNTTGCNNTASGLRPQRKHHGQPIPLQATSRPFRQHHG